jgi:hypothetical protein
MAWCLKLSCHNSSLKLLARFVTPNYWILHFIFVCMFQFARSVTGDTHVHADNKLSILGTFFFREYPQWHIVVGHRFRLKNYVFKWENNIGMSLIRNSECRRCLYSSWSDVKWILLWPRWWNFGFKNRNEFLGTFVYEKSKIHIEVVRSG